VNQSPAFPTVQKNEKKKYLKEKNCLNSCRMKSLPDHFTID
jgi:hypothetical protein